MLTLAIDTAASFCSACLWDDASERVVAEEERDIGRGHAEQLMQVVERVMRSGGCDYADLGCIAVAIGPGSFTGIRVGVASARGFGLALGIPVTGVTTLETLAADAAGDARGPITVTVKGGRGQFFMQDFDASGHPLADARAVDEAAADQAIPDSACLLVGNAAAEIAEKLVASGRKLPALIDRATGNIATVARLSARSSHAPVPLYLRGADARPQEGFALARADVKGREAGR